MRLRDKLLETKNVKVNRQLFVRANDVHTCASVSGQHNHLQNEKTALALHFEFSMSCLGCRFNYFLIQASCPFSGKEKKWALWKTKCIHRTSLLKPSNYWSCYSVLKPAPQVIKHCFKEAVHNICECSCHSNLLSDYYLAGSCESNTRLGQKSLLRCVWWCEERKNRNGRNTPPLQTVEIGIQQVTRLLLWEHSLTITPEGSSLSGWKNIFLKSSNNSKS